MKISLFHTIQIVIADSIAPVQKTVLTVQKFVHTFPKPERIVFPILIFTSHPPVPDSEFQKRYCKFINKHISSKHEYSHFMCNELVTYVNASNIFVIQNDSAIEKPQLWRDEFLYYDYIGAPWWYTDGYNVGNGGFSIRSKSLMQEITKPEYTRYHPEDHIIGRTYRQKLEAKGLTFAPEYMADIFAYDFHSKKYKTRQWDNDTFGIHGIRR